MFDSENRIRFILEMCRERNTGKEGENFLIPESFFSLKNNQKVQKILSCRHDKLFSFLKLRGTRECLAYLSSGLLFTFAKDLTYISMNVLALQPIHVYINKVCL